MLETFRALKIIRMQCTSLSSSGNGMLTMWLQAPALIRDILLKGVDCEVLNLYTVLHMIYCTASSVFSCSRSISLQHTHRNHACSFIYLDRMLMVEVLLV